MNILESAILLTANITTGAVTLGDEEAWTPKTYTWGEAETLAFRFVRTNAAGDLEDVDLNVTQTMAACGFIDARPASGTFRLQVGAGAQTVDNTTGVLFHDCDAKALRSAINGLPAVVAAYGLARVEKSPDGSWYIIWGTGAAEVPYQLRENTLQPASSFQRFITTIDGVKVHELRLLQLPVAFSDVGEAVLPDAPGVDTIANGAVSGDTQLEAEIQVLTIPRLFRGSYCLSTTAGGRTTALSRDDAAAEVQAALEVVLGKGNVRCVDADSFVIHIYFAGALEGVDIEELTVTVVDHPPGYLTTTLDFGDGVLLRALRAGPQARPLEVWVWVTEGDGEDAVVKPKLLLRQTLSFRAPLVWPDLAEVSNSDWLRPPSPTSYNGFSRDAVTTGYQFYPEVIGNGAAHEFPVDHNLDTHAVMVQVWENPDGGRQLTNGTDFRVNRTNANTVLVTALIGTPGVDGWYVIVFSNKTVSQFAAGLTIDIDQVNGLAAALAALSATVAALAAQAATVPLGVPAVVSSPLSITLEDFEAAFPWREIEIADRKVDLASLPEPAGWLLPAIHTATVTSLTTLPLPALGSGAVWQNNTGVALTLPGGGGWPAETVAVGEYFGRDPRKLYKVSRAGETTSYFPTCYETPLFQIPLNDDMLRAGASLAEAFKLYLRMYNHTSQMQCDVVVEHGAITSQSTPSTTAPNFEGVTWNTSAPILSQRVTIEGNGVAHPFGIELLRSALGVIAANKIKYGFKSGGGSAPASGNIELRGRCINWDTRNNAPLARGTVFLRFEEATVAIQ